MMTIVQQSQWEDLDGFQIDWDQFLIPYRPGCHVADDLSYALRDACFEEDKLTICAILWFMLYANGLYLPPRTYAYRCDPSEVESLILDIHFEARCGEEEELQKLLIEAALAAGLYGTQIEAARHSSPS